MSGAGIVTLFGLIYSSLTNPDFSLINPSRFLHRNGFHCDIVEKQYPGISAMRYANQKSADYIIFKK